MEFDEFITEFGTEAIDETFTGLAAAGAKAYELTMQSKTFRNKTGNLSASIGYTVTRDGRTVAEGGFKGSSEGASKGCSLAGTEDGLHFVAGMDYASHVEAKGYDVNTAGELLLDRYVEQS